MTNSYNLDNDDRNRAAKTPPFRLLLLIFSLLLLVLPELGRVEAAGISQGLFTYGATMPKTKSQSTEGHRIIGTFGQTLDGESQAVSQTVAGDKLHSIFFGLWGFYKLPPLSPFVTASDGDHADRIVITWKFDVLSSPPTQGYKVYRNNTLLIGLPAGENFFNDVNVYPGQVYNYGVTGISLTGEGGVGSDPGFVNPNGTITGHIQTSQQRPVIGADVGITPNLGQALVFDGADDYAVLSKTVALNGSSFTVEFWAKRAAAGTADNVIGLGDVATTRQALTIGFQSNNKFVFSFLGDSLVTTAAYTETDWHHWAVTYNKTTKARAIYRDGRPVATNTAGNHFAGSGDLWLGKARGGGYFGGSIDDVRIWSKTRSEAELTLDMNRAKQGNEDSLTAYWKLDEGNSSFVFDLTAHNHDGKVYDGGSLSAVWSADIAPVRNTGFTNTDGNYIINGIYYGTGTTFTVTPKMDVPVDTTLFSHEFSPGSRIVTLNTSNTATDGVDFTDISLIPVSGFVQYANTLCFPDSVEILVNGESQIPKVYTNTQGAFTVELNPGGDYRLTPVYKDHSFAPVFQDVLSLVSPQAGLAFVDTKVRTLTVRVYGGPTSCMSSIRPTSGTMSVTFASTDGCYTRTENITSGNNLTLTNLPPLNYALTLNHPAALSVDGVTVSLKDTTGITRDLVYRKSMTVNVTGLPTPDPACAAGYTLPLDGGTTLNNLSILTQLNSYSANVDVYESYTEFSGGVTCAIDTGYVTIYNAIGDSVQPAVRPLRKVNANTSRLVTPYTFKAGRPNFTSGGQYPYAKSLEVGVRELLPNLDPETAEDTPFLDGREGSGITRAYVLGIRKRDGGFTTLLQNPILPLYILRDPPGDASFATMSNETQFSTRYKVSFSNGFEAGLDLNFGGDTKVTTCAGIGVAVCTMTLDTQFSQTIHLIDLKVEHTTLKEMQITSTFSESFSTLAEEYRVGEDMDLYVGLGSNIRIAQADELKLSGCALQIGTAIVADSLGIESTYLYTDHHIRNVLLPELTALLVASRDSVRAGQTQFAADTLRYFRSIRNWTAIVDTNAALKAMAVEDPNRLTQSLSFDSNFGGYTITNTRNETHSQTYEHMLYDENGVEFDLRIKLFGVVLPGPGHIKALYTHSETVSQNLSTGALPGPFPNGNSGGYDSTWTRTTSVTLADNDPDDYFWIQIYDDGVYGNVYKLVGGATTCPWEPGTLPRQGTQVEMIGSTSGGYNEINIPPDQAAIYKLILVNTSQTFEDWYYDVSISQDVNPEGAIQKINGYDPAAIVSVLVPGQFGNNTLEMMLTVERGPIAYDYEDLEAGLESTCEVDIAEIQLGETVQCGPGGGPDEPCAHWFQYLTQYDVHFLKPCSDVRITAPNDNITMTAASDSLKLTLAGYDRNNTDFKEIQLQYRPAPPGPSRAAMGNGQWAMGNSQLSSSRSQVALGNADAKTEIANSQLTSPNEAAVEARPASAKQPMMGVRRANDRIEWIPIAPYEETYAQVMRENEPPSTQSDWITFDTISRSDIPASPGYLIHPWYIKDLADGKYEVRAVAACNNLDNLKGYSRTLHFTQERKRPAVIATEPGDQVLQLGDAISVTFDEALDCSRIIEANSLFLNNIGLYNTENSSLVNIAISCLDNQIFAQVENPEAVYPFLENKTVRLKLAQIKDLAGNIMDANPSSAPVDTVYNFEFYVNRNPIAWEGGDVTAVKYDDEVATITRKLINNGASPMDFSFMDLTPNPGRDTLRVPSWMTVTPMSGTVNPGTAKIISLTFDADLIGGNYAHELRARTTMGDEPMLVDLQNLCHPPDWPLALYEYEFNMTIAGKIVSTEYPVSEFLTIAAFVGSEVRGKAVIEFDSVVNDTLFYMVVGSDSISGEPVTLRVWDGLVCVEVGSSIGAFTFAANSEIGSPSNPHVFDITGQSAAEVRFNPGWNWFSINMAMTDLGINTVLEGLSPASGDLIKSQSQFSQYVAGLGWVGSLSTLNNKAMYMLKLTAADNMNIFGTPIKLALNTIPIQPGWNWISYQPVRAQPINVSLASLTTVANGDLIKNQYAFAQYVAGLGWVGNLDYLEPSMGYMLKAANPGTLSFPWPPPLALMAAATVSTAAEIGNSQLAIANWQFDPAQFEHNMTVTGEISQSSIPNPQWAVGAFVGDECRGTAEPVYIESLQKTLFFLLIHSNQASGETVEFRLLDQGDASEYAADQIVKFEANASLGDIESSFVWTARPLDAESKPDALPMHFALAQNRPNPFAAFTTIQYALPKDANVELSIYNVAGQKVRTLVNERQAAGYRSVNWDGKNDTGEAVNAGVYFYRLKTDAGFEATRKLLLVK